MVYVHVRQACELSASGMILVLVVTKRIPTQFLVHFDNRQKALSIYRKRIFCNGQLMFLLSSKNHLYTSDFISQQCQQSTYMYTQDSSFTFLISVLCMLNQCFLCGSALIPNQFKYSNCFGQALMIAGATNAYPRQCEHLN